MARTKTTAKRPHGRKARQRLDEAGSSRQRGNSPSPPPPNTEPTTTPTRPHTRQPLQTPDTSRKHLTEEVRALISGKDIVLGKNVDFAYLRHNWENYNFQELFERVGLVEFCRLQCETYPSLVKEFYEGFTETNHGLKSILRGHTVKLSFDELNDLLGVPKEKVGLRIFSESSLRTVGFSKLECLQMILGNEQIVIDKSMNTSRLSVFQRVIHHVITNHIIPRAGSWDYLGPIDLYLLQSILVGRTFHLGFIIIKHMVHSIIKPKGILPYGMVITKILRQKCPMDMFRNENALDLPKKHVYDKGFPVRMGFRKQEGFWVSIRAALQGEAPPQPSIPQPETEPSLEPSTAEPSAPQSHFEEGESSQRPQPQTHHAAPSFHHRMELVEQGLAGVKHELAQFKEEIKAELKDSKVQIQAEVNQGIAQVLERLQHLQRMVVFQPVNTAPPSSPSDA